MTISDIAQIIHRVKWHLRLPFFIALDNSGIRVNVQLPGYKFGVRMFFTKKKRKVVRPLQHEIDHFISTRSGRYGEFSTAKDHKHFIEQFVDSTGIRSVEDINDYVVSSYLEGMREIERTESRRLMAVVAIKQFVAFMDRKDLKQQQKKIGRPPKTERNMEMVALRKFDPKHWSIQALATKYGITKRAVWEILDRYEKSLSV